MNTFIRIFITIYLILMIPDFVRQTKETFRILFDFDEEI